MRELTQLGVQNILQGTSSHIVAWQLSMSSYGQIMTSHPLIIIHCAPMGGFKSLATATVAKWLEILQVQVFNLLAVLCVEFSTTQNFCKSEAIFK